jgi:transcriptional repressor NrdR
MICPFCREKDTSVVDSRPTEDGTAIRRRRVCTCGGGQRFTTFERVQFRELTVMKKNGRRSPFEREKLAKSIFTALKKRPIDNDTIEKVVSKISRELEELGQSEIQTSIIGKKVMDSLRELDKIGYIRFASVYTNFKEVGEFEDYVEEVDGRSKKKL